MNVFDWGTLGIIAALAAAGYARGFLKSVFGLVSLAVSYLLAWRLYPYVSVFLRGTELYAFLQQSVAGFLKLDRVADAPQEALSRLPLPDFLAHSIAANNNAEAYKVLGVETLGGYISGFFANALLNLISMALVFLAVFIVMRLISGLLGVASKLPVIGAFNRLGGLLFGIAEGVVLVWAVMAVITFAALRPGHEGLSGQVRSGPVAGWFYANNPVMKAGAVIKP
ncbi:MAG: CvpA family protein [Firmicutes bacterium]|nr:CvpA family protein [Bacillota bacterium]